MRSRLREWPLALVNRYGQQMSVRSFTIYYCQMPDMLGAMIARLTLDKLGRIVLPKPMRDKLQLVAGDQLELESLDDRIVVRPLRETAQLRKKHGVWVFHGGEPLSAATSPADDRADTARTGRAEPGTTSLRALFDTSILVPGLP